MLISFIDVGTEINFTDLTWAKLLFFGCSCKIDLLGFPINFKETALLRVLISFYLFFGTSSTLFSIILDEKKFSRSLDFNLKHSLMFKLFSINLINFWVLIPDSSKGSCLVIFWISYFSFLQDQGVLPVTISYSMTPKEKISDWKEYLFDFKDSNGMYNGVPTFILS